MSLVNAFKVYRRLTLDLDVARLTAVDGYTSACCDLDLWPFDSKTEQLCLQTQVHMWSDFGEISSSSYKDIAFARFSGLLPAVTLTIYILTRKISN